MQLEYRANCSMDRLRKRSESFQKLPDIQVLRWGQDFMSGTEDEVLLRFMTAKYEVGKWYSPERLRRFIALLNEGRSFAEAYIPGGNR